jgi:MraZ protein
MLLLTGEYQHVIDNKNRVLISNKLRAAIDSEEHGANFYLMMGPNGVLCLYPEKHFELLVKAAIPPNMPPDEALVFERMSFALASKVELDGQGRLLLNERLRTRAGLKDRITLVGVRDHIELWNNDQWDEYMSNKMPQFQQQIAQARQKVLQTQSRQTGEDF